MNLFMPQWSWRRLHSKHSANCANTLGYFGLLADGTHLFNCFLSGCAKVVCPWKRGVIERSRYRGGSGFVQSLGRVYELTC